MAEIGLRRVEDLSGAQKVGAAFDVWLAMRDNPGLTRELPLTDINYKSPLHALHRVRELGRTAAHPSLSAFAINDGEQFIGMASRKILRPNPDVLGTPTLSTYRTALEIAYWHREARTVAAAVRIGTQIVGQLLEVNELDVRDLDFAPWMVTLPDDGVKAAVCEAVGFEPIGQMQKYDVGDGVIEPRQLWALK